MAKLSAIGPTNPNLAEQLKRADQALQKTMSNLDKGVDKHLDKASAHMGKAGADAHVAGADAKLAGKAATAAVVDTAVGLGTGVVAGGQAAKGVGFTIAGAAGKLTDAVRAGIADAMVAVGKAFLHGSSNLDGRAFLIAEFAGDPKAKSWGDRMMDKGFAEFTKSGHTLTKALNDLEAGAMAGVYTAVDIGAAGKYLAAAAGQTLAAAKETGQAVIIANAEAAVVAADAIVKGAEAGNEQVAQGLASAGMKLIQAQNEVNTAKNSKYLAMDLGN
jgi:hypothetical protein